MALPLRRQIVLLNAAVFIPVFVAVGWSARQTYNEQLRELAGSAQSIATTLVAFLERGLDMGALQTVIEEIPLAAQSVITITDNKSVVLARSREPAQYIGRQVEMAPVPAREVAGTVVRLGLDGTERVFGNAVYEPEPLLVSVGIPTSVAFSQVLPVYRRTIAISLGVTLFVLVVEFLIARHYTKAFDATVENSARVADGDLSARPPISMPSLELERMQSTFLDMVSKLRETRQALDAQIAEERRIREELELLQRQVIRQERLAAIGVLVSGVAHELNNPLQAILGFAELLQMQKDLPPHIVSDLELIQRESARASGIIRNLSRFGRQQTPEPTRVTLRDVVASVVELRLRKLDESHIRLEVDSSGNQWVMAVFTELQQVVLNLLINAEHAVVFGMLPRRIIIRTLDVGDRARLEVQDSGPGVPREHEPKLFQPFFTTKAVGEGTGLGLSISYGIIESHGGTIGYRAAAGGGALFFFELPAAPASRSAALSS